MVSLWYKYKKASKHKKTALHSLIAGLILFSFIYVITKFLRITLCPIQSILGVSCLGCGLSRGFIEILSFNFARATQFNVLSIPLFCGILIYAIICVSDILLERNDLEKISQFSKKKFMFAVYLIIFVVSAYFNYII